MHYLVGQTKIICLPLLLLLGARAQGLLLAEYNGINLHQNDLLNFFINVDATNGQKGAMNNLKLMAARVGETGGGIGRSTGPNDQKRRKQKRSGQNNAGNQWPWLSERALPAKRERQIHQGCWARPSWMTRSATSSCCVLALPLTRSRTCLYIVTCQSPILRVNATRTHLSTVRHSSSVSPSTLPARVFSSASLSFYSSPIYQNNALACSPPSPSLPPASVLRN